MRTDIELLFTDKSVAIAGFGVEGKAAYRALKTIDCSLTIIDQDPDISVPDGVRAQLGENWTDNLDKFDIVLRTSGLHPDKLSGARMVTSSTQLLLEHYRSQVIGVTGTKGKSTTVSLIAEVLKAAGQSVELVGNIGRSAWEILATGVEDETTIVTELSSFQLSDVSASPHGAVLLPIVSDHLDWHGSQQHYLDSKLHLVEFQTDGDWVVGAAGTLRSIISKLNITELGAVTVNRTRDYVQQTTNSLRTASGSLPLADISLPGQHNLDNISLALAAAIIRLDELEVDIDSYWSKIAVTVTDFEPLNYHLQQLGEVNNHLIINDSYSSTPIATAAALDATSGPKSLIFGGQSRGIDLTGLLSSFDDAQVEEVFVIGADSEHRQTIAQQIDKYSKCLVHDMNEQKSDTLFENIINDAQPRTTILFSPGHPSFDMYKDFNHRGQKFTDVVEKLQEHNE